MIFNVAPTVATLSKGFDNAYSDGSTKKEKKEHKHNQEKKILSDKKIKPSREELAYSKQIEALKKELAYYKQIEALKEELDSLDGKINSQKEELAHLDEQSQNKENKIDFLTKDLNFKTEHFDEMVLFEQMKQELEDDIRNGKAFYAGIARVPSFEDSHEDYSKEKMNEIRKGLERGLDLSSGHISSL